MELADWLRKRQEQARQGGECAVIPTGEARVKEEM
jgi:hypothetical protein